MEHNAPCQQLFTGFAHDDCNRRSDDVFIHHTINASSSGFDQVARRPLKEDISNKPVNDNFPVIHDNSDDEHDISPRAECMITRLVS